MYVYSRKVPEPRTETVEFLIMKNIQSTRISVRPHIEGHLTYVSIIQEASQRDIPFNKQNHGLLNRL